MVDRLAHLKSSQTAAPAPEVKVSVGAQDEDSEDSFMPEFFDEVDHLKGQLVKIEEATLDLKDVQTVLLASTSSEEESKASDKMNAFVDEVNDAATDIRNRMRRMDVDNKKFSANRDHQGTAEDRIRQSTYAQLSRKFVDVMSRYQENQEKFKVKYDERMRRQIAIVKPNATPEEVKEIMTNTDESAMAGMQILSPGHTAMKSAFAEIQERHRDILRIEASVMELHQMFVDMATLVEAQGEMLDQIEYNVGRAVGYTAKAAEEVTKAGVYQREYRKKLCCMIVIVLIILVVILVPVLSKLGKS